MISCGGDMGFLSVTCDKQKDAEPFEKMSLVLRTIKLGSGRSSCVIVPFDGLIKGAAPKTDATTKKILAALETFEPEGATATEWERACEKDGVARKTFYRRRKELIKADLVKKYGEVQGARYRLVKKEPVPVSGGDNPMT